MEFIFTGSLFCLFIYVILFDITDWSSLCPLHFPYFLGHSGAEIGRFIAMLRNPSSILKACAAFALLQVLIAC